MSIIRQLSTMLNRPGFLDDLKGWQYRSKPDFTFTDIFDGRVWKQFSDNNGELFFDTPNNIGLMINIDWMQPFSHLTYSVGAIYLVICNLPRHARFRQENVIIAGVMPGPKEPSMETIHHYMRPIVQELQCLWKGLRFITEHWGNVSGSTRMCRL
jgi:hypothetical protein